MAQHQRDASPHVEIVEPGPAAPAAEAADRRREPRRRLRDRIASLDRTSNPTLLSKRELKNLTMLVEDDLRQTALSLGQVESFLSRAAAALEDPELPRASVQALADDDGVADALDALADNLDNLRRRMGLIAASLG